MADKSGENICVRCRKPVGTGVRCTKCGTLSHKSCLKSIKGVKFFDGSATCICCSDTILKSVEEAPTETVLSDNGDLAYINRYEEKIKLLQQIIKEKDEVIKYQGIAISSLDEQINLLKQFNQSTSSVHQSQSSHKRTNNIEMCKSSSFKIADVSAAIHSAQANKVCDNVINLQNDAQRSKHFQRNILIGSGDTSAICPFKSASIGRMSQLKHYHVMNMEVNVDERELEEYLTKFAPNVKVIKLKSRYPTSYSSFKVSVPTNESNSLLEGGIWPKNVVLNHFFPTRKRVFDSQRQVNSEISQKQSR